MNGSCFWAYGYASPTKHGVGMDSSYDFQVRPEAVMRSAMLVAVTKQSVQSVVTPKVLPPVKPPLLPVREPLPKVLPVMLPLPKVLPPGNPDPPLSPELPERPLEVVPVAVPMPAFDIAICTLPDRLSSAAVAAFWSTLDDVADVAH